MSYINLILLSLDRITQSIDELPLEKHQFELILEKCREIEEVLDK